VEIVNTVAKRDMKEIMSQCRADEEPEFVIGSGIAGSLAAFKDRCVIVKKGWVGGFMAGATGGGRATVIMYSDVTGVEFNSGFVTGVLEVLSPSFQGSRKRDFWNFSNGESDPWQSNNCLPLQVADRKEAEPFIQRLRDLIAAHKSGSAQPSGPSESQSDLASQLADLGELHGKGLLSDDEFSVAKRRILGEERGGR
jgi:hypothetical protein